MHHLRAWYRAVSHQMQFTVGQVTVQYLVGAMTYTLLIMPIRILVPTLILASHILFQMELQTRLQYWLELITFHLTMLRYFISLESRCLFYPHARRNHQKSKKNYTRKNHFKTDRKAESIEMTQHFDYSMFYSWFSLLIELNGTHVLVRWSVTRSEAVCECRSFQSIFWTSKADAF